MFQSARLKLTVWYVCAFMVTSVMFSAVINQLLVSEVRHFEVEQRTRIQQRLQATGCVSADSKTCQVAPTVAVSPELLENTKRRIVLMLLGINLGLLAAASLFSYILAGKTLQPIQEMLEGQNRFISDVSHELRTPLTSLRSGLELFLRDKQPRLEVARITIQEALYDATSLQALAESMLQLAQYQQPRLSAHFERVSLKSVIQNAVRRTRTMAERKHITLKTQLDEAYLVGVPHSLTDMVVIFIDNAIKYSPEHSTVKISTHISHQSATIAIADQGIGIKQADLAHIFERFFRADAARTKTNSGGYGLGLAIAHQIISLHKGTIRVSSEEGRGTTFLICLPLTHPTPEK